MALNARQWSAFWTSLWIWDYDAEHFSNVIDVYIRNLRQKLCAAREPDLIQTVRGSGYQLKEPVR